MKKLAIALAVTVVSFSSMSAYAGGWGKSNSGSLINISPKVDLGDIAALNDVLNGAVIGNGNTVGDILSDNGILNGNVLGILSGNSYKLKKH